MGLTPGDRAPAARAVPRPVDCALGLVDLEPKRALQHTPHTRHPPCPRRPTPHVAMRRGGIAGNPLPAPLQLLVELVQELVCPPRGARPPLEAIRMKLKGYPIE